jgi:hypothetical protein
MLGELFAAIWKGLIDKVSATQVCWLCLAGTMGMAWMVTTRYATADEMKSALAQIAEIRTSNLRLELIDLQDRRCKETDSGKRRWFTEQIGKTQKLYAEIEGKDFSLPQCGDL